MVNPTASPSLRRSVAPGGKTSSDCFVGWRSPEGAIGSEAVGLTTLLHVESSPTALSFVPQLLLPKYGWAHREAGSRYPETEVSFRQTIHGGARSDRGFGIIVDRLSRRVLVSFDAHQVAERHTTWLQTVHERVGDLGELDPQPYWGFEDLYAKLRAKLHNCFYCRAKVKIAPDRTEQFFYDELYMCEKFSFDRFLDALDRGSVFVDSGARTGHNHGTKFRLRQGKLVTLYEQVTEL